MMLSFPEGKPIGLNFDYWMRKADAVIQRMGLNAFSTERDICVTFSNKRKKESYGSLTINKIKRNIRKKWKMNDEIEEILEGINSYEDCRRATDMLPVRIKENNPDAEIDDIRQAITKWVDDFAFKVAVLGEYIHDRKTIVLYTKNIKSSRTSYLEVEELYEATFVHELFHAYHYQDDAQELLSRGDYTSRVVKESLASAFEWFYCASFITRFSGEHTVLTYPYTGAYWLADYDWKKGMCNFNEAKFVEVFKKSLTDMDGALRILLPKKEFYGIKNAGCK